MILFLQGDIRSVYPTYPPEPPPDYDEETPNVCKASKTIPIIYT